MYKLIDDEVLAFRNDVIFNSAINMAFNEGLSKEEALSKLCVALLNLKDESFQEKVNEEMTRPNSRIMHCQAK